jgi:hypothetical protein
MAPTATPSWRSERARYASLTRSRPADDPDLRAARAEKYLARVVAEAPPLTAEQRDRLVVLLRGPASAER